MEKFTRDDGAVFVREGATITMICPPSDRTIPVKPVEKPPELLAQRISEMRKRLAGGVCGTSFEVIDEASKALRRLGMKPEFIDKRVNQALVLHQYSTSEDLMIAVLKETY